MNDTSFSPRSPLKRIILSPLVTLAVVLVLIEEHLWAALVRLGIWLGRLPALRLLEARIAHLPPWGAALALLTPAGIAIPVKLAAVWAMTNGHFGLGLVVLLTAKVVATALAARIYTLTEPALMTVPWFVRLHDRIVSIKGWAHNKLEATPVWHAAKAALTRSREWLRIVFSKVAAQGE